MCGITGLFHVPDAETKIQKALSTLACRGKDGTGIATPSDIILFPDITYTPKKNIHILGHCLHALVSHVPQPLRQKGTLVANCEIYNWKELAKKYTIPAHNDSTLLLALLDSLPLSTVLDELDGDYAFIYWNGNQVIAARDIIGVKPLWYTTEHGQFALASEKKALTALGYDRIQELNPRTILHYALPDKKITEEKRLFYSITPEHSIPAEQLRKELQEKILQAVKKRIPDAQFGILFSGGIDSTLLAFLCQQLGKTFTCYTAVVDHPAFSDPKDEAQARLVAEHLHLPLRIIKIPLTEIETLLPTLVPLIEDSNVTKVGVALPFYFASKAAAADGVRVLLSGLGSEEIFAGYERHKKSTNINNECLSGLLKLYERDLYRDDVITMYHTIELRVPFLDRALISYALKIPASCKITDTEDKAILRAVCRDLGIPPLFTQTKKRAAQYGSNFDKALAKLAKQAGMATKSAYLLQYYQPRNLKLGVLFSSGKDSMYALHLMHRQNYTISCLITIKSTNKDSYMFHTPNIDLAPLQAEALGIPILMHSTQGTKEGELTDLKDALLKAQQTHHIDGVVTGALYSTYQRDRIEKICDELGLKIFSPLWHKDQEQELRELIDTGFEIIISSIAADGFGEKWLGKQLTLKEINELLLLHKHFDINIAGEGGEYESFVLDAPLFKKRIVITEATALMHDTHSGIYSITKAHLAEKP